jgi:hypothetical protein
MGWGVCTGWDFVVLLRGQEDGVGGLRKDMQAQTTEQRFHSQPRPRRRRRARGKTSCARAPPGAQQAPAAQALRSLHAASCHDDRHHCRGRPLKGAAPDNWRAGRGGRPAPTEAPRPPLLAAAARLMFFGERGSRTTFQILTGRCCCLCA